MNRANQTTLDTESLQADVMRFMAIIGFCLIAILALVRNVEPPPPEATVTTAEPPPAIELESAPIAPEIQRRAAEPVKPAPIEVAPQPKRKPTAVAVQSPTPQVTPPPAPVPAPAPAPVIEKKAEGLVLKFASDADFLNLIASRRVQVYAWTTGAAYRLEPGFALKEAGRPNRVFELLADTIPVAIRANLARLTNNAEHFTWAVSFPPDIEANLTRLRGQHTTGLLLIDRKGGIKHVANS